MLESCTVVVVMPAWNEEGGIATFIEEIKNSFPSDADVKFVVVDDASTDQTASRAARDTEINVTVASNASNLGHGPSTLEALRLGLGTEADYIVSTDGDGQFFGPELAGLVETAAESGADVVEGIRIRPREPFYRKLTSLITRALVAIRARSWPTDANTPTRAYRRDPLEQILAEVPPETAIPNLYISVISRRLGLNIGEVPVVVRDRLGGGPAGTSWGGSGRGVPSRRFVSFCGKAIRDWMRPRK